MNCLVCGNELIEGEMICKHCRFDLSTCPTQYPTLSQSMRMQKTLWKKKREYAQHELKILQMRNRFFSYGNNKASQQEPASKAIIPVVRDKQLQALSYPKEYVVKNGVLTKYTGVEQEIIVPDGITTIGKSVFASNQSIRRVVLPESVTKIYANAFYFSKIQTISLPTGLVSIGLNAFSHTDIREIVFPQSLKKIGENAFSGTLLEQVIIPGAVRMISNGVFSNCKKLQVVRLESGVKKIDSSAFKNCPQLRTIHFPDTLAEFDIDPVFGTFIQSDHIQNIYASDTWKKEHPDLLRVLVPDAVEENNFVIEENKLIRYYGRAESPNIPESVTEIGSHAFAYNSYIVRISIPDRVTAIETSAFFNCCNLCEIQLPNKLQAIGKRAFIGTQIKEVHIPESLEMIAPESFDSNKVKMLYISTAWEKEHEEDMKKFTSADIYYPTKDDSPDSQDFHIVGTTLVRYQGKSYKVDVPNCVTEIGTRAFADLHDLCIVNIPESVSKISSYAFFNCKQLSSLGIPGSVCSIGEAAFANSGIQILSLPEHIKTIPERMCENCSGLKTVNIPMDTTCIKGNAFYGCEKLINVLYPKDITGYNCIEIMEGNGCLELAYNVSLRKTDPSATVESVIQKLRLANLSAHTVFPFLCAGDRGFTEKYEKVKKAYFGIPMANERPILIYDESMLGNGKSGFIITSHRISYKQLWEKGSFPLSKVMGFGIQGKRFGFAVSNNNETQLPYFAIAKSDSDAKAIIEELDDACAVLNRLLK